MATVRVVLLLLSAAQLSAALDVVLLEPTTNGTVDVGIIITPGADIDGTAYKQLGEAIQKAFQGRMWVALLSGFPLNTPNPLSLSSGVDQAIAKLNAAGFKGNNIFLAGHSLGGVFVGMYGQSNPGKVKGVMLFASYLTRSHRLRDYPVPVLTISGDLDGLTRITRIVDTFEELENETINNPRPLSLIYTSPVIVMRGVNHGHFASGTMPANVKSHDIAADVDVTYDVAHQMIASHVSNFVIATVGKPVELFQTALAGLKTAYLDTKATIQPLSMMKAMDTNKGSHSITTEHAQLILLGPKLSQYVQVNDTEIPEHDVVAYEPEVHVKSNHAHVQTYSSIILPFDPEDVSEFPQTPSEIQAIMKSKEGMKTLLPHAPFDAASSTCRDVNKYVYAMAVNASSDIAKTRAKTRNAPPMTLLDDVTLSFLPEWLSYTLKLDYGSDGQLGVTSYAYVTHNSHLLFSSMGGTRHCKLLSPYRAMEWFYLDSLKRAST